jgi:hypothetical protein
MLVAQLAVVKAQILENDRRIMADARSTELVRRLMTVPGVGPLLASALVATVADPRIFRSGRDLAAWIGLVPRQNSGGGKERLGSISKAGHRYLRQMLVVGSMAVIRHAGRRAEQRPLAEAAAGAPQGEPPGYIEARSQSSIAPVGPVRRSKTAGAISDAYPLGLALVTQADGRAKIPRVSTASLKLLAELWEDRPRAIEVFQHEEHCERHALSGG